MSRSELPRLADLNGLIIIDKPAGLTSHDVVSRIRHLVGMKRVGHGGTLDPFATGVLVVAVGRATRLLQYVQDSDKQYRAHVVLGAETDTCDVEGSVVSRATVGEWPGLDEVERVLQSFMGEIEQRPPVYAAIKIGGRKLYELAREGIEVDIPTRTVTIHSIDLVDYEPPDLVIDVWCGKGTYIRSLARDIGLRLGVPAYCHDLRRTQTGPFSITAAWTLDSLAERDVRAEWPTVALHPDAALVGARAVILSGGETEAWYHGRSLTTDRRDDVIPGTVRVYGSTGRFLGVGRRDEYGVVRPIVVVPVDDEEGER